MTTLALKLSASATPTRNTTPTLAPNAYHWDLAGVLALLASSACYAVYALGHLAS